MYSSIYCELRRHSRGSPDFFVFLLCEEDSSLVYITGEGGMTGLHFAADRCACVQVELSWGK